MSQGAVRHDKARPLSFSMVSKLNKANQALQAIEPGWSKMLELEPVPEHGYVLGSRVWGAHTKLCFILICPGLSGFIRDYPGSFP